MAQTFTLRPIGHVHMARDEAIDDGWDALPAAIHLDPEQFGPEALAGLETFSHVEIIFVFDRVGDDEIERGARHPRGRKDWPLVGIFAQRGKGRPNRLGHTVCALERIEGLTLHVRGLDAIDGTPVVDIKPWMAEFGPRGPIRQPAWASELMKGYW